MDEMNAAEALYGFAGWLTSRDGTLQIGSSHDAAIMAELVEEFCKTNKLTDPRPGWEKEFRMPDPGQIVDEEPWP